MIQAMKNVLIVGAHYDDCELGVGGTAAKLKNNGINVYKLTLTNNQVKESFYNYETSGEKSFRESKRACKILGTQQIEDFPMQATCELIYSTNFMQRIEAVINGYNIDTVFTHSEHDVNQDHAVAGQLCKTAARHCKNIYVYQSNMYINSVPFYPSVFVDISDYFELKRSALNEYSIEHQRFAAKDNTLFENVLLRNRTWGYPNGVLYAEGFTPYKVLL